MLDSEYLKRKTKHKTPSQATILAKLFFLGKKKSVYFKATTDTHKIMSNCDKELTASKSMHQTHVIFNFESKCDR